MADNQAQSGAAGAATEQLEGSLLDQILNETKIAKGDDSYDVARRGVEAFIAEMLSPQRSTDKVDKAIVDSMIAEIDRKLSAQLDEIIHHKDFQRLESTWRGLKFSVDRTDFRENIKKHGLEESKR